MCLHKFSDKPDRFSSSVFIFRLVDIAVCQTNGRFALCREIELIFYFIKLQKKVVFEIRFFSI